VVGVAQVPEPSKGCLARPNGLPGGGRGQATVDRYSEAPVAVVVRLPARSAWEEPGRNPGPGRRRQALEGQSPREQPAVGALIQRRSPGTLERVKAQEPRPIGPAHPLRRTGTPMGETVCGCFRAETHRIPFGRRKLRRANPKSAAGMKQDRHGLGRSKPP
jgi:hypothetical protein